MSRLAARKHIPLGSRMAWGGDNDSGDTKHGDTSAGDQTNENYEPKKIIDDQHGESSTPGPVIESGENSSNGSGSGNSNDNGSGNQSWSWGPVQQPTVSEASAKETETRNPQPVTAGFNIDNKYLMAGAGAVLFFSIAFLTFKNDN